MDVQPATTVACVRDEHGATRFRSTVPTEAGDPVAGARRRLASSRRVREGPQVQRLYDLLQPHVERVVVCNVRGKSEFSNKSNRLDVDAECNATGALRRDLSFEMSDSVERASRTCASSPGFAYARTPVLKRCCLRPDHQAAARTRPGAREAAALAAPAGSAHLPSSG
jgi:hypothetical protein